MCIQPITLQKGRLDLVSPDCTTQCHPPATKLRLGSFRTALTTFLCSPLELCFSAAPGYCSQELSMQPLRAYIYLPAMPGTSLDSPSPPPAPGSLGFPFSPFPSLAGPMPGMPSMTMPPPTSPPPALSSPPPMSINPAATVSTASPLPPSAFAPAPGKVKILSSLPFSSAAKSNPLVSSLPYSSAAKSNPLVLSLPFSSAASQQDESPQSSRSSSIIWSYIQATASALCYRDSFHNLHSLLLPGMTACPLK